MTRSFTETEVWHMQRNPTMSKVTYENTAAVISRLTLPIEQLELVCLGFAKQYKLDNPNFKPHLFFKACGLDEVTCAKLKGFAL